MNVMTESRREIGAAISSMPQFVQVTAQQSAPAE
jgi:hypothetical protein